METIIIRGEDNEPGRIMCRTCGIEGGIMDNVDGARAHCAANPSHIITLVVLRTDLMIAGRDIWHVSPYTMAEAAEGPGEA